MSERTRLGPARRAGLRVRAEVLAELRRFFAARDFLEIEAPLLVRAPALEVHLEAVRAGDGYLITSPEFQMKRLLAAGLERIYTVCRCFRAGERGHQHAVEFTMLEWYRAGAGLEDILADTEALVAAVAERVCGAPRLRAGGRAIDVTPPWQRLTVRECFARWVGAALEGDEDAGELAARLRGVGIELGTAVEWDDVFFQAFVERIEPELAALDRAVVVTDWPVRLGALARRAPGDPRVVERFEAYVGGIELANAFGELTCATEQRERFLADQEARRRRGFHVPPIDDKLLAALEEGLPPSGGIALGIDRLAMLAAGASDIREVSAFLDDEL